MWSNQKSVKGRYRSLGAGPTDSVARGCGPISPFWGVRGGTELVAPRARVIGKTAVGLLMPSSPDKLTTSRNASFRRLGAHIILPSRHFQFPNINPNINSSGASNARAAELSATKFDSVGKNEGFLEWHRRPLLVYDPVPIQIILPFRPRCQGTAVSAAPSQAT